MPPQDGQVTDPTAGAITPPTPNEGQRFSGVEPNVIDPDNLETSFSEEPIRPAAADKSESLAQAFGFAIEAVTQSNSTTFASNPSDLPNREPIGTAMPTNLDDLVLHSPSSQIIGTPFVTNSTRFEYPFPDVAGDSPLSSSSLQDSTSNGSAPPSMISSNSSPITSLSPIITATSPQIAYSTPSGSSMPPLQFKLKHVIPPVPPSLMKKRPKWSLGLLGRRRSSQGSHSSGGDSQITDASIDSIIGSAQRSPPLSTSKEEREPQGAR